MSQPVQKAGADAGGAFRTAQAGRQGPRFGCRSRSAGNHWKWIGGHGPARTAFGAARKAGAASPAFAGCRWPVRDNEAHGRHAERGQKKLPGVFRYTGKGYTERTKYTAKRCTGKLQSPGAGESRACSFCGRGGNAVAGEVRRTEARSEE